MSPLEMADPFIFLALTLNMYCRFHMSISLVNDMPVCINVEEILRSVSLSMMTFPVFLSPRMTSALHTGELCRI